MLHGAVEPMTAASTAPQYRMIRARESQGERGLVSPLASKDMMGSSRTSALMHVGPPAVKAVLSNRLASL
jgi:hypothetical protein